MNHSVHFHTIPCIITHVTKEHVSEDDITFTKVPGLQGLKHSLFDIPVVGFYLYYFQHVRISVTIHKLRSL